LRIVNADTVVVPGHGAIGDRRTLIAFADLLRVIEGRVQSLVASRSTPAEIIAAAPTREFDAVWGSGHVSGDILVRMIVAGLGLETKTNMPARPRNDGDPSSASMKILCLLQVLGYCVSLSSIRPQQ
jgi:hypothetical protein